MINEYSYIGHKQSFVDAKEKVKGTARYLDDLVLQGMLYGKILRSPHPHAKILSIDTSEAEKLPGVHAVITAKDCPPNHFGLTIPDTTILATDKVRYVGDEVAAVAADSEKIAEEAIKLIKVNYEVLPAVVKPEDAIAPDAPLLHEDKKGNVATKYHFERGNIDDDFARCDYIFEDEFKTSRAQGCYMEPFGVIAEWDQNERLTIWTGIQAAFHARNEIALALGIKPSQVRLRCPYIGGAFGAKIWIRNFHPIAAVLARKTNRPVKIVLTREEEMMTTRPRVAAKIRIKLGMMADGTLVCKETKILADNGAYSWAAPKILFNMSIRTDCLYRFQSTRTDATLAYTNLTPTSGMRGYGNTQMHFAVESIIDKAARKIGLDPAKVKIKNAVRQGDVTIHGWKLRSCGLTQCLEKAYEGIKEGRLPKESQDGRIKRGIGVACMTHVSGNRGGDNFDGSAAMVRFHEDGRLFIYSGESDMGQGARTVFAQIVAETMGIPIGDIVIMPLDTDISPFGYGTYSSRVTTVGGKAVYLATKQLKEQLLDLAAKAMEAETCNLEIKNGLVYDRLNPGNKRPVADIAKKGIRTKEGRALTVYYTYDPPTVGNDPQGYGDYSSAYTYGAHGVEVEVDTETGRVKVLRIVAAHDVGKAINVNGVNGQIYGGIAQGMGYGLLEDTVYDNKGMLKTTSFRHYIVPTIKDMPKIKPVIVETNDPVGPYGAKGIGEPTLIPTAPAIANAIEDAVGVRINDLPITSEKLFWALHPQAKEDQK